MEADKVFRGEEEPIIRYCRQTLKQETFDYFVFGHRHLPCDYLLSDHARYFNIGDWIFHYSYLQMKEGEAFLKYFVNK